jgi:hypothetical protein
MDFFASEQPVLSKDLQEEASAEAGLIFFF